jgi:uncharacterized protein YndB with AHSA1/START domain
MRIERTIEVPTSPVKAYKILADPTNIPRYAPDIESVSIRSMTPRLVGTRLSLFTNDHSEIEGEVVEASMPSACAFRTADGRTIRWLIEKSDGTIRLVNSIETDQLIDESRVVPELERKLRALRNTLLQGARN